MRTTLWLSEIFIADETIALGVTLEDALDQALRAMVLLVGPLIELVRTLSSSATLASRCSTLPSTSCLASCSLAFLRDSWQSTGTSLECLGFLLFNLCANIRYFDLILAEIDAVECDQCRDPNLELCSERVIFRGLAGKHWINRVFD